MLLSKSLACEQQWKEYYKHFALNSYVYSCTLGLKIA